MASIDIGDLAGEIVKALEEYTEDVVDKIDESATKIAKESAKELKSTSPKKTGEYAKNWAVKTEKESGRIATKTIHVRDPEYRLSHLLEHGHAKRGGGRVAGVTHIAPVEKKAVKEFEKAVEEAIKNG